MTPSNPATSCRARFPLAEGQTPLQQGPSPSPIPPVQRNTSIRFPLRSRLRRPERRTSAQRDTGSSRGKRVRRATPASSTSVPISPRTRSSANPIRLRRPALSTLRTTKVEDAEPRHPLHSLESCVVNARSGQVKLRAARHLRKPADPNCRFAYLRVGANEGSSGALYARGPDR